MRTIRSFIDQPLVIGQQLALPEPVGHHLVRVLRLEVGDACVLFNGDGHDYTARLLAMQKRDTQVEIVGSVEVQNESPLRVTLVQGIVRGDKMDLILQKATELGVAKIAPVSTDRTEIKLDRERTDKKMQHWRGVLAAACEQCGRACLPEILEPQSLAKFAAGDSGELRLVLDPDADNSLAELRLLADMRISLAIGPEGGFSERDLATLHAGGYQRVRLGPRILRTETAGMAAIAAINALFGDWR